MKKLLLGLGSLASIAAPVATVVACNKDPKKDEVKPAVDNTPKIDLTTGDIAMAGKTASSNSATLPELQKGLSDTKLNGYTPLAVKDVTKNHPAGPKSSFHHNYKGAVAIINAVYKDILKSPASIAGDDEMVLKTVQAILKALLKDKDILTNNASQNLNTAATAQKLFKVFFVAGKEKLKAAITELVLTGFERKKRVVSDKKTPFIKTTVSGSAVTVTLDYK